MMKTILTLLSAFFSRLNRTSDLAMENLALRQQLVVMKRSVQRPRILMRDRIFWILMSRFWDRRPEPLIIVKPSTVIGWHKEGFKLFWRWKSRAKRLGRPTIDPEIRGLVRKMAMANLLWGAPRIHGELLKLGIDVSERTVSNLMPKTMPKPPSQTWRSFLKNHMHNMCSVDFFVVPTAAFKILFVFVVLSHSRRKVLHFNVTANPTARWTTQQIIEAYPWNTAPKYLLRDRDAIYGKVFDKRVQNMDIEEVLIAPRSPWQNPYVERFIGSTRRECLDHVIVLNEGHLKKMLSSYFKYYNEDRTHLGIDKDTLTERPTRSRPAKGKVIALPRVGGLHHRHEWQEAA